MKNYFVQGYEWFDFSLKNKCTSTCIVTPVNEGKPGRDLKKNSSEHYLNAVLMSITILLSSTI